MSISDTIKTKGSLGYIMTTTSKRRPRVTTGMIIKREVWLSEAELYHFFVDMLLKMMLNKDPFALPKNEVGPYSTLRTPVKERQRIFNTFIKKYPDLVKHMKTIIQEYVDDIRANKYSRKSTCHCPFPFACNTFPCKNLSCDADICSNGYTYRMS